MELICNRNKKIIIFLLIFSLFIITSCSKDNNEKEIYIDENGDVDGIRGKRIEDGKIDIGIISSGTIENYSDSEENQNLTEEQIQILNDYIKNNDKEYIYSYGGMNLGFDKLIYVITDKGEYSIGFYEELKEVEISEKGKLEARNFPCDGDVVNLFNSLND